MFHEKRYPVLVLVIRKDQRLAKLPMQFPFISYPKTHLSSLSDQKCYFLPNEDAMQILLTAIIDSTYPIHSSYFF